MPGALRSRIEHYQPEAQTILSFDDIVFKITASGAASEKNVACDGRA